MDFSNLFSQSFVAQSVKRHRNAKQMHLINVYKCQIEYTIKLQKLCSGYSPCRLVSNCANVCGVRVYYRITSFEHMYHTHQYHMRSKYLFLFRWLDFRFRYVGNGSFLGRRNLIPASKIKNTWLRIEHLNALDYCNFITFEWNNIRIWANFLSYIVCRLILSLKHKCVAITMCTSMAYTKKSETIST